MKKYEKEFMDKDVMITGGLGFIGSNLAHSLVDLKANVLIVDSLLPQCGGNIHNIDEIRDKVKVKIVDIRNEKAMSNLVKNQDFIFNLAGHSSHVGSMRDPFLDLDINCRGNLTLLESCRKNNLNVKVIYTGTRGQYGKIVYTPVDEKHPMNVVDINGISKLAGEQYHMIFYKSYGIKTTSIRLTNTYGPRHQMKHGEQGFLNWFIRLAMDNKEIKIFDGKQLRDLNYVDDVVEALLMVAINDKTNGEVFNLGSGNPMSVLNLTKLIIKMTGSGTFKVIPYPKERKKIEIGDYIADISKIKKVVGWSPKTSLKEGLKKTIEFYRKNKSNYW